MSDDLLDRLRLIRTPGIGPIAFRQLLLRFGSAERRARRHSRSCAARRRAGAEPVSRSPPPSARWRAVEALGARFLSIGQGLYPRALAELENAPPLVTVKGRIELLEQPMVAIVGARNASAAACRFARGLAHDLGREGVSGRVGTGARDRQRGA